MKVICCLKTFSFTDSPLAGYGIVYCILAMGIWFREINILYFLDFSSLHIKAGSFLQVLLKALFLSTLSTKKGNRND